MSFLYNLSGKKFKQIFFAFSATLFIVTLFKTTIYTQTEIPVDWTLPFKPCENFIPGKSDIKEIASDNKQNIYLSKTRGSLESINITDQKSNWEVILGSEIISNLILDEKNIYVASNSENTSENETRRDSSPNIKLRAISRLTGITLWQTDLKASGNIQLTNDEGLKALTEKYIYNINTDDGSIDGKEETNKDNLFLKTSSNVLNKIDLKLFVRTNSKVFAENSEKLLAGNKKGDIYSLDKITGRKIWQRKIGGEITSISFVDKDKILVGSLDNFLYLFSIGKGNQIWKKRLPNRITENPQIIENIAVISDKGSKDIFIIELEKGRIINRITIPENEFLFGNIVVINKNIILQTNSGIYFYSQSNC